MAGWLAGCPAPCFFGWLRGFPHDFMVRFKPPSVSLPQAEFSIVAAMAAALNEDVKKFESGVLKKSLQWCGCATLAQALSRSLLSGETRPSLVTRAVSKLSQCSFTADAKLLARVKVVTGREAPKTLVGQW